MERIGALYVDQYCLTMAQSFWRHKQNERVSFELFVRSLPKNRDFLLVAGLETALDYLKELSFTNEDIDYLKETDLYDSGFLDFLRTLRFTGDVDAILEGTVIGANVPILRVTAPRIEATLVESALLTIINHQTMIASKAARIVEAAQGRPVWDFSLRRLHGPHASIGVARAAYIAGCAGTATVEAGKQLNIPTTGTMAHHFVQHFGPNREVEAFAQFMVDYPDNSILLVDTYDAKRGIRNAIKATKIFHEFPNIKLKGIRLDSGDLVELSKYARQRLDKAGFSDAIIVASNDLDEYKIRELVDAEAPIDSFGVGTMLGTSADAPHLGGVFKIVMNTYEGVRGPVMKFSENKETNPGMHQVFRAEKKKKVIETIALIDEPLKGEKLLQRVMNKGQFTAEYVSGISTLDNARQRAAAELDAVQGKEIIVERSPMLKKLIAKLRA